MLMWSMADGSGDHENSGWMSLVSWASDLVIR